MICECKAVFNSLSAADRLKLRGAALTKSLTGFIKEDTRLHPVRFPLYAAYLVVLTTPLPFPFASTLLVLGTLAWTRYSNSAYAGRLNNRLKESFNEAALACEHKDFISPDPDKEGAYTIKNWALFKDTTVRSFKDSWAATKYAWSALWDAAPK